MAANEIDTPDQANDRQSFTELDSVTSDLLDAADAVNEALVELDMHGQDPRRVKIAKLILKGVEHSLYDLGAEVKGMRTMYQRGDGSAGDQ